MERRPLGRDRGLTTRMAAALAGVALLYLGAAAAIFGVVFFAAQTDGLEGVLASLVLLALLALAAAPHFAGPEALALRAVGARRLHPGERPALRALVDRVAAQAGLPAPGIAVSRSSAPNAFSVGLNPSRAVVVVTTELLRRLQPSELEAVIAHELAHVANRDGAVMTVVGAPAVVGAAMWRSKSAVASLLGIYWPIQLFALLVLRSISRYREYAADAGAVMITGAPENLMSALLAVTDEKPRGELRGGAALRAFCIAPTGRSRRLPESLRDHPSVEKRIARLERMTRELGKPAR